MDLFEKKFGLNFITAVPAAPGIYKFYDQRQELIYIGKAKNLHRRIAQYKNAKRRKRHRKMLKIMKESARIEFKVCSTEQEAEVLETELIQTLRPKWNVVGAFYFLYPMLGVRWTPQSVYFCYTTEPNQFEGFSFHGAFRSRKKTQTTFFSMIDLLGYLGHALPKSEISEKVPRYSYLYGFRQLPSAWEKDWNAFMEGRSKRILEKMSLALVENAKARKDKHQVQENLNHLVNFWTHEAKKLLEARIYTRHSSYPISQKELDLLFLRYRYGRKIAVGGSQGAPT